MLKQKLVQLLNVIKPKRNQQHKKEKAMPMGKGTYGSTRGRPPAKKKMTAKQKTLPAALQKKIMAAKKKKK